MWSAVAQLVEYSTGTDQDPHCQWIYIDNESAALGPVAQTVIKTKCQLSHDIKSINFNCDFNSDA